MLPKDLWKPWEPRVSFPAFAGTKCTFEFTVQETLDRLGWRQLASPLYAGYKKVKTWPHVWHDYQSMLLGKGIEFSVYRLKEDGTFIEKV